MERGGATAGQMGEELALLLAGQIRARHRRRQEKLSVFRCMFGHLRPLTAEAYAVPIPRAMRLNCVGTAMLSRRDHLPAEVSVLLSTCGVSPETARTTCLGLEMRSARSGN